MFRPHFLWFSLGPRGANCANLYACPCQVKYYATKHVYWAKNIQSPKAILERFATQVELFLSKFFSCNGPLMEPNHISYNNNLTPNTKVSHRHFFKHLEYNLQPNKDWTIHHYTKLQIKWNIGEEVQLVE